MRRAGDDPVGVVPAERERVVGVGAAVRDPPDALEELGAGHVHQDRLAMYFA